MPLNRVVPLTIFTSERVPVSFIVLFSLKVCTLAIPRRSRQVSSSFTDRYKTATQMFADRFVYVCVVTCVIVYVLCLDMSLEKLNVFNNRYTAYIH